MEPKIAWALVIAYCALIYSISAQPNPEATRNLDPLLVYIVTTIGHFFEYSVLGFFLYTAFKSSNTKTGNIVLYAFAFAFFYALTDEFHQSFVPGRDASIMDIAADLFGAYSGIVFSRSKVKGLLILQK